MAAPRGPKRSAAHRSTGNTMYGTSRCGGSSASTTSRASTRRPRRRRGARCRRAARGPREQDRRDDEGARRRRRASRCGTRELVRGDHVPETQRRRAERRADERRHERRRRRGEHVDDALDPPRPCVSRRSSRAASTTASVLPTVWPRTVPERRREVAEQQIADHDPRPQPHAVEEQDGEPEARGRPQRRDGSVEVGQLQPDPAGDVVGGRDERHLQRIQAQRPVSGPAQRGTPPLASRRLRPAVRTFMASIPAATLDGPQEAPQGVVG